MSYVLDHKVVIEFLERNTRSLALEDSALAFETRSQSLAAIVHTIDLPLKVM